MTTVDESAVPSVSLEKLLNEKFKGVDQQFAQHQREHQQHDSAHQREHEDSQKAIDTAATLAKENKKDANEWRSTMDDREKTLATKVDIGTLTQAVNELKSAEIKRAEAERLRLVSEAKEVVAARERQSSAQWRVGIMVGLAATVGSVLINAVLRLMGT